MHDLDHRFRHLDEEYSFLKQKCEGNVTTWKWATGGLYDPRPFWYERNRWKPGRFLKSTPSRPNGKYEYGYDAAENLLVERQHVSSNYPDRCWYYETFHVRAGDVVESAHFEYHPDKRPIYLARSTYQGDRLILWESRAQRGSTRERYHWDDRHVNRIEIDYAPIDDADHFFEPTPWQRIEAKHNDIGLLEELVVYWFPRPDQPQEIVETVYHRLEETVTFEALLDSAREKLFDSIIQIVSALDLKEPVYCLALTWSPGQFNSLPPLIGLGLERERKQWIAQHGEEAKWYLWSPGEFSLGSINKLEDNEELSHICELLNQECGLRERWNDASRLLNEVAKLLGEIDWSGKLQTTTDFVSYATECELSDLRQNLKFSVPSSLFDRFKREGWIP